MEINVWVRYTHPTVFETAPYGTIWKEMGDDDNYCLFIQLGKGSLVNWVRMGTFLEKAFKKEVLDKTFIKDCLDLYEDK